jgi:hypothetical protein
VQTELFHEDIIKVLHPTKVLLDDSVDIYSDVFAMIPHCSAAARKLQAQPHELSVC